MNTSPKAEFLSLFPVKEANSAPLGTCHRCGESVREGTKGFFCDNRMCGFKIWRESKFWTAKKKPLTAEIVATLLKDSRVEVKGLYSGKTGKKYDATVFLDDKGEQFVNFRLEF
jgi:DNA topoisomerase-3